ncbi:SDR family NAD(P)-dependent oxidoreductase [Anaerolineales bacterium HSG25]|nr:SDR family NAD(P)-dependent oxidoreductase [Anaerolineales bacterium HSG25]
MSDQVCVIVGAGAGIGSAVARRFAREGYQIVLLRRNQEALDASVAELKKQRAEAYGYTVDASDNQSIERVFDHIKVEVGEPEVLVYNAAVIKPGYPSELDPDMLTNDLMVNVVGALTSAQQVIHRMQENGHGTILFTGGGLALTPNPQYASLAVGKAGLRSLCYSLAEELTDEGVHVATVTIAGYVTPGSHFDPDLIAEKYWRLHTQPSEKWTVEIVYD